MSAIYRADESHNSMVRGGELHKSYDMATDKMVPEHKNYKIPRMKSRVYSALA